MPPLSLALRGGSLLYYSVEILDLADWLAANASLGTNKIWVLYQMQPALPARYRRMCEMPVEARKPAAVRNG